MDNPREKHALQHLPGHVSTSSDLLSLQVLLALLHAMPSSSASLVTPLLLLRVL